MTETEALVRRAIDAHNRGAGAIVAIWDETFDPDLEWTPMTVGVMGAPEGASYRGREGMERFYAERAEAFAGGTVEVLAIEPAGQDALVVRARSTATGRTSGVEVDEEITLVYWFRAGKIFRLRAFRSAEEAQEVVGA
jgi:ketosteroid isomerase-like protein